MTHAFPLRDLKDIEVFRGVLGNAEVPGTATWFGFTETRRRTRADATAWGSVAEEITFRDQSDRIVTAGDTYERQAIPQPDGSVSYGAWSYVGRSNALQGLFGRAVSIDWAPQIAPGQNMRTPLATLLYDEAGTLITRPAVGEQDLDPWTGEPLFDDQGQPVLVPATEP